ncbi:MAG: hypothetical protein P1R58_02295 [bacterium]|nr:hypothetical protein [bacterium]
MVCSYCGEEILSKPIRQVGEYFCSLECANSAEGAGSDEAEEYYDESDLEGLYEEEEENS